MLGLDPVKVRTGYVKFDVPNPPLNLTLNEVPFTDRGALSHLGIQVASTDDVLAWRERWAKSGLITRDEMQTNCCYAMQDKTWVRDPDGNEWEAFVVLEDNLLETAPCACGDKVLAGEHVGAESSASSTESTSEAQTEVQTSSCCGTTIPVSLAR
jgi:hypothetical protein